MSRPFKSFILLHVFFNRAEIDNVEANVNELESRLEKVRPRVTHIIMFSF